MLYIFIYFTIYAIYVIIFQLVKDSQKPSTLQIVYGLVSWTGKWRTLNMRYKIMEDIQWLEVEYAIYLMFETGFLIFSWKRSTRENIKIKILSHSWNRLNSIFSNKNIDFCVYYIFFVFGLCFFQIVDNATLYHLLIHSPLWLAESAPRIDIYFKLYRQK